MPIYAYKCEACGHQKDILQKLNESPVTLCPSCSADTFRKQLTAPGFQLKGSGWYVTDFRDGRTQKSPESAATPPAAEKPSAAETTAPAADTKPASTKPPSSSA